ncbi:MAG: ABC transporter ATP-binding protein [Bacilli bacterium]|nr:ABC transporter ATP-binding protein [Bacilli bacterium]
MIKEYYQFIKEYLRLANPRKDYLLITFLTALFYKAFALLIPFFASWIIKYATVGDFNTTYLSLAFLGISYVLYHLFLYFNYRIYGKNMQYCYTNLHTKILNKLMTVDENFTKKISKGKLLNSINSDVLDIGDMLDTLSELLMTLIQVLAVFVIISCFNIYLSVIFAIYAYIYIASRNYYDKKVNEYYEKQKKNNDQYSSLFSQILNGLQEIKTFHMLPKLHQKLNKIKKEYSKNYMTKRKYYVRRENDVRFITHTFSILLYIVLVLLMIRNIIRVDILVLVIGYFESMIAYLDDVIESSSTIREVNVAVKRVDTILHYRSKEMLSFGDYEKENIKGVLEFENVSFSYGNKEVIKDMNLKIIPKQITAIVGESGTGKTSIFNLILRLYQVDKGTILLDGKDIYEYKKSSYSSMISVVNQKPFIFNMSIRKNLDFVDKDIGHQIDACKRVGIHDFISTLPDGYNTILREDATNISGGQKQLISLARTLLTKSKVLLFDEITSSLDPETADHITHLLKDLKKDHTIIMITHKPELMKQADRIVVIKEGKIVGDGTHKELMKNNTHYAWLQTKKSASKMGVFDND